MSNEKKTVITIEAWQQTRISRRNAPAAAWCERCGSETTMFSPEEFARRHATAPRMVYRSVEDGGLHFIEIETGALLICENSAVPPPERKLLNDGEQE